MEAVYQLVSDNCQAFLRIARLKLFPAEETPNLSEEQKEGMFIIFSMLVSLFEPVVA